MKRRGPITPAILPRGRRGQAKVPQLDSTGLARGRMLMGPLAHGRFCGDARHERLWT